MEKTPREKFNDRLKKAVLEPDDKTPNTINRERLYMLKKERGYDEYFDDFVKKLTESINDDPEAYHTPKELEEALATWDAAHKK